MYVVAIARKTVLLKSKFPVKRFPATSRKVRQTRPSPERCTEGLITREEPGRGGADAGGLRILAFQGL